MFKKILSLLRRLIPRTRPSNTGLILGNAPTDWFYGANSPIVYNVRLPDGNWSSYAFDQEIQYAREDTMSCVTQSAINSIQAQEFFLTGQKVNYSKRWIAKMSGTTRYGNSMGKVADTIRKYGLVREEDYPTPPNYSWNEFYADIPAARMEELTAKGKAWLEKWEVAYEFLLVTDPNLDYHLKHAPIQVAIPGHAICGVYSPNQLMTYLDSYMPFFKNANVSQLQSACKIILTSRVIKARRIKWKGHPEVWVALPMDSMERLEKLDSELPSLFPPYVMDTSRIYEMPVTKPVFPE